MSVEAQYCTFFLNGMLFGVEVTSVQEVLRSLEMTPVPLAPAVVRGLINLRGRIVTAIDVKRRLDMGADASGKDPSMSVVIRANEGSVSLLVDDIHAVLDVDQDTYEAAPDNLSPALRDLILGTYKLQDRLLMVLDVQRLVEFTSSGDEVN